MGEKKGKSPKSKIEIQTRKPEKRGIFANLGSDRSKNDHPLREILNFPLDTDNQNSIDPPSQDGKSGYPKSLTPDSLTPDDKYPTNNVLDSQNPPVGYPDDESLDSQKILQSNIQKQRIGYPTPPLSDSSAINRDDPSELFLDIQKPSPGYPYEEKPDSNIAKAGSEISKKMGIPDSNIAGDEKLDSQKASSKGNWKKYEKKRTAKGLFLRTNDEITKKFKQFCIANDWDFSQGTELAWNKLMNDLDIQSSQNPDSLIALDDRRLKMMFKTKVFIINLYLRYNSIFNEIAGGDGKKWSARWSPRDDDAARRYNDLPPAIIELGILQTQIQKGFRTSRIQTFKYYTDEIEKVLASGVSDEMLETILNYHRQIWKNQTGREIDLGFLMESA